MKTANGNANQGAHRGRVTGRDQQLGELLETVYPCQCGRLVENRVNVAINCGRETK